MAWVLLAISGGIFFLFTRTSLAMTGTVQNLDAIFQRYGIAYGVDPLLLKAIAMRESSLNPEAINAADHYSVGLMQVLYRPRDEDNLDAGPKNHFNVEGWDQATFTKLKDPDFNVKIGAQILAWNIRTFGLPRGIAVYNAWDQRDMPINGPFKNQAYVDGVLSNYRSLTA